MQKSLKNNSKFEGFFLNLRFSLIELISHHDHHCHSYAGYFIFFKEEEEKEVKI
jgi:hypothetical protein